MDALRWTPEFDNYLSKLMDEPEWEGDRVLAAQVRCHLIMEEMTHSQWAPGSMSRTDSGSSFPSSYIKALRAQVQDARRSLSSEVANNGTLPYFCLLLRSRLGENKKC